MRWNLVFLHSREYKVGLWVLRNLSSCSFWLLQPLRVIFIFFRVFLLKNYFIILIVILSIFIFWLCHGACGILVPQPGIEPTPLQWKHRVPTTGWPGKSCDLYFWVKFGAVCKETGPRTRPDQLGGFRTGAAAALGCLSMGLSVLHQELARGTWSGVWGSRVHHSSISMGFRGLPNCRGGGSCRGWKRLRVICPKFTFPERSAAAGEWIWGFLSPPEQSVYKSEGNQATGETVLNDLETSAGVFLG